MIYRGGKKVGGETSSHSDDDTPEDEAEQTALIPKSLVPSKDVKVGDEIRLTVKHIFEDEYEVGYGKDKHKEKHKEKTGDEEMADSQSQLDNMAE